jgi:hypothetical protein
MIRDVNISIRSTIDRCARLVIDLYLEITIDLSIPYSLDIKSPYVKSSLPIIALVVGIMIEIMFS